LRIWTPAALSSEALPYRGDIWRLVEAQHVVATLKLTDTLAEQALLEDLIEVSKPKIPLECAKLDVLLATPFRYAAYPRGSRFRRGGLTPGVFYAAEAAHTAVAEMAFYRLLFYAESPATKFPENAAEYTAFAATIGTDQSLDLTRRPFVEDAAWTHLTNYAPCQDLAEAARKTGIAAIRYRSVRDPEPGHNVAVLACAAFAKPQPVARQSWRLRISTHGVQAICEFPRARIGYGREAFAADARVDGMAWDR
jgi:hypothetical protein